LLAHTSLKAGAVWKRKDCCRVNPTRVLLFWQWQDTSNVPLISGEVQQAARRGGLTFLLLHEADQVTKLP
jgi:hypothetical protein